MIYKSSGSDTGDCTDRAKHHPAAAGRLELVRNGHDGGDRVFDLHGRGKFR